MRKELKILWDEIINPNNKDRLFDLISLYSLMTNNEISEQEFYELKQYANGEL